MVQGDFLIKISAKTRFSSEYLQNEERLNDERVKISADGNYVSTTLSISYAKLSDSGLYSCKFTNINGTDDAQFNVYVSEPPLSSGIIAGIVIISIVVIVLLGLLMHKIRQDRVLCLMQHLLNELAIECHFLHRNAKSSSALISSTCSIRATRRASTPICPWTSRPSCCRTTESGSSREIASNSVYTTIMMTFVFLAALRANNPNANTGKQLGAGAFGRVVKGDAIGIVPTEPITTVAVKMVRSQGNMLGLKALMSELKIMVHMGSHLNIVNLLGACTKNVAKGTKAHVYITLHNNGSY